MLACVLMVVLVHCGVPVVRAQLDKSVCTPSVKPVFPPPPAMTTTKLLSLNVEWRETRTKRTYNVQEYYDDERMLSVLNIQMPPQQDVKVILDDSKDVAMVIELPTSQSESTVCTVVDMGAQMFRYDYKPWLTSLMFLYRSMLETKDTEFVANSTITTLRSYPVQEWRACMYDFYSNITTQLRLFFSNSNSGWITPHLPPNEPILVSVMLHSKRHNKTSTEEFDVVGDIVDFTPYPTFPSNAFMTPPGVYCPGRPLGPPLPMISDKFYMSIEVVNLHTITFDEIWYDVSAQKIRHDTKSALGNDPNPKSTVFNFVTGVRYEKDMYLGTCDVETIQAGDDYTAVTSNNFIAMKNVSEVFHYDKAPIQYAGEATTRGALCDVWIGVYFDVNSNVNATVQWYFTKRTWKEAVDTVVVPGSFFRMDLWQGGSTNPVIHNIHKYTPEAQHWAVFDYGSCYNVAHRIHFVIQLLALDKFVADHISKPYLYDMMQDELASLIYEEPNRFSNILVCYRLLHSYTPTGETHRHSSSGMVWIDRPFQNFQLEILESTIIQDYSRPGMAVEFDGGTSIFMSGLFLDKTPIQNYQLAKKIDQRPLTPAYNFLKGHIDAHTVILITNIHGDPVRLQTKRIEQVSYSVDFSTSTTHSTPTTRFRIPTLLVPTLTPRAPKTALPPITHAPSTQHVTTSKAPLPRTTTVKRTPKPATQATQATKATKATKATQKPVTKATQATKKPAFTSTQSTIGNVFSTTTVSRLITFPFTPRRTPRPPTKTIQKPVVSGCTCPACNCLRVSCPPRAALQCPTQTTRSTVAPPVKVCPTESSEKQTGTTHSGISGAFTSTQSTIGNVFSTTTVSRLITFPFTPRRTPRPPTKTIQKPVVSGCTCPACNCLRVSCPPRAALQCPTQTTRSTVAPPVKVCPTESSEKQTGTTHSGISGGAVAGAVIISLLLGALLCFLVLVLVSRRRELPLLQYRHEDTETIPLGNY